ncbi:hypothetical protein [Nesterenkonia sp. Act20]|uniref:hypothetical protein n=1 Tax=Nesterenkonia sp. Act20 TaxID=1483432 RepID=UPI001C4696C8|nr:hypothetical protein [Nesterenkonia sp. Act20]
MGTVYARVPAVGCLIRRRTLAIWFALILVSSDVFKHEGMRQTLIRTGALFSAVVLTTFSTTSCGSVEPDDTYDSVEDFRSALDSGGFSCEILQTKHEFDGYGESMSCAEGHSIIVWDGDLPTGMQDLGDGDVGTTQHLRGENWDVSSSNSALLNDMQETVGGERTARGFKY